jgi:conjugal transfer mating pair stabilization protein TraG
MSTFYVVTYGNGELLSKVFSAIAQALHGNNATFKTLFHLSLVLGGTWAIVNMILQRNILAGVQWLGIYYIAFYILLLPSSAVVIVDRINTDPIDPVDNVPLGVAVMASYTSAIGDSVTQLIDRTFSFNKQLRYSQSGIAKSSDLVAAASNFQIPDPDFEQNLQAFLNQCVFYDVLSGKYSTKELLASTDLWGLLKRYPSPIRTFLYDQSLTSCEDGATLLEEKWGNVIQEIATRYGSRLFPDIHSNEKAADQLIDNLGISYAFLSDGRIAEDGRFLIQQNAMSNAIYNGILAWATRVGAGAAVSNGNFNRTVQQNRMSAQSIGQDMGNWVSMLKNVCESVSYAAFVIMILLMLFPVGWRLLKNYIYTHSTSRCWFFASLK